MPVLRMRRQAAATPDGYLSSFPTLCWSMRKRRAAYSGACIRVRRSSDNAEQDIGFDAAGWCDAADLLTFAGGASCYVTKWYEQSAAARHLEQGTAAKQPRIVSAGTVDTLSGKPSMVFDGADDWLAVAANAELGFGTAAWALELWATRTDYATPDRMLADLRTASGQNASFNLRRDTGLSDANKMYMADSGGTVYYGSSVPMDAALRHFAWTYGGSATSKFGSFLGGAATLYSSVALTFAATRPMTLGANFAFGAPWPGRIVEVRATNGSAVYTAAFTPPDIYADS